MSQKKSDMSAMSIKPNQIKGENVTSRFPATNFMYCSSRVGIFVFVLVGLCSWAIHSFVKSEELLWYQRHSESIPHPLTALTKLEHVGKIPSMDESTCIWASLPWDDRLSYKIELTSANKWHSKKGVDLWWVKDKIILWTGRPHWVLEDKGSFRKDEETYMAWQLGSIHYLICRFPSYKEMLDAIQSSKLEKIPGLPKTYHTLRLPDITDRTCMFVELPHTYFKYQVKLTSKNNWSSESVNLYKHKNAIILKVLTSHYDLDNLDGTEEKDKMMWELPNSQYLLICKFPSYAAMLDAIE